ncbi:MAG: hypothetical protein N2112_12585 [Gemmataceae bacterium]|jgi:hypothetical protein|nr:hypothetical protein [Gemmataceae bacterium]
MNVMFSLLPLLLPLQVSKAEPVAAKINTVQLTVSRNKAPVPRLRYQLLPATRDLKPMNAAVSYHRAILIMGELARPKLEEWQKTEEKMQKALASPLSETPKEFLRQELGKYPKAVGRELELAARCQYCDWSYEAREEHERLLLLIPEIQKLRDLARYLQIKVRLALAEDRIEDALNDIQTGLAMARHISDGAIFINNLVGLAITNTLLGEIEKLMTHPQAPNLYYALAHLPQPILNHRRAVEGEMRLLDSLLPKLKDLERKMNAEEARKEYEQFHQRYLNAFGGQIPLDLPNNQLALAAWTTLKLPSAKKFLIEQGRTEEQVNAMPALQVILLESTLKARDLRDEIISLYDQPYTDALKMASQTGKKIAQVRATETDVLTVLTMQLVPSAERVLESQFRTERKLLTLQTIEAIRLHESTTGKLPEKLSDIQIVAVPKDPGTGQYFDYEKTEKGFILKTPPLTGINIQPITSWRYELILNKK